MVTINARCHIGTCRPTGGGASTISTRTVSLADEGVGDAGQGTDQRKFKVPNVRFLPIYHRISSSDIRIDKLHNKHATSHRAYRSDGGRRPLVRTFLRGGLASPMLDRDVGTAMTEAFRTCWILGQGVRPTFSMLMPMEGSSSTSL
jgi:hypothetical protein